MNERIKLLAEQATRQYSPTYYTQEWIQGFAELIVRECLADCESVKEQFYNGRIATDDFNLKNRFAEAETACDMIKTKIEMRFGAEP